MSSSDIEAFLPLVSGLAHRYSGLGGSEYDDLVQEGLIHVWLSLERGVSPSADLIAKRMIDWTRFIRRQQTDSYEEVMGFEL